MTWLIWIGAAITMLGFAGIVYSIVLVTRIKKADLPDEEFRNRLQRVIPVNMGSLLLSFLGLMLVVAGVFFSKA